MFSLNLTGARPKDDLLSALGGIAELRAQQLNIKPEDGHHAILYASGFLQKGDEGTDISQDDIDGFLQALSDEKGRSLTLVLHTPGGDLHAVETIVEYLHSKCDYLEVIVPVYAMSAGAVISLASDHLIMSAAGQLGPFDMQLGEHSARVIKESHERAMKDIQANAGMAHYWGRTLQSMNSRAVVEAEKGLSYTKQLADKWLARRGLLKDKSKADKITAYFNAEPDSGYGQIHLHGQRIDLAILREMGLDAKALEDSEDLKEAVLDAYWLMTEFFQQMPATKFIASSKTGVWVPPLSAVEHSP